MKNKILPFITLFLLISSLGLSSCSNTEAEPEISSVEGYEEINGTEIFYQRMGNGEPIVMVHGGPVLDHGYLVPYFKSLANDYELIYFDQRLSGRSSAQVDSLEVRLDNFVDDIEELRQNFNLEKIHLAGHSWGGLLAMNYAIKYPDKLRSLILLNSMPGSSELWRKEEQLLAQRASKEDSLKRQEILNSDLYENNPSEAIEQLLVLSFRNQFYDSTFADSLDFYIPDDYMERSELFGNVMVDIADYDLHENLSSLEVPTLLIYGDAEPAIDLSGKKLDTTIPNSEFITIEKSGHFPFIEQTEEFIAELRNFLDTHTKTENKL